MSNELPRSSKNISFADFTRELSNELAVDQRKLSPSTRLVGDLGLAGDDVVEFFEWIESRFGVDPTEFAVERIAGPEGAYNPILQLFAWITSFRRHETSDITLQEVFEIVARGITTQNEL